MTATSTTDTVSFVAPWRENDPTAPRFILRAGSVIERGQMEAELSSTFQAGRVFGFELREAIRAGVSTLLADDPELDHILELIDAEGSGEAVDVSADDKRMLKEINTTLGQHWPDYRDLVAQLERRREIAPIVALRRFCVGIEGDGIVFARDRNGHVAESTLSALEPLEIAVAGNRAYGMQYAIGEERFLLQPSPSDGGPLNSSPGTSTAAGSSATTAGRKTRAPRSPRGRSKS